MLFAVMCSISLDYRNWFVHDNPWPIRLTGRQLRVAFADGGPIETEVVDAIIRLLQEEDTWMYKEAGCNERQWRQPVATMLCRKYMSPHLPTIV